MGSRPSLATCPYQKMIADPNQSPLTKNLRKIIQQLAKQSYRASLGAEQQENVPAGLTAVGSIYDLLDFGIVE